MHGAATRPDRRPREALDSLPEVHARWVSRRALSLHVTVAVVVPACLALTAWQVDRAVTGNTLSWVYSFEWPFFAGYALYMWWRLIHEDAAVPPADLGAADRRASALGVSADGTPASGRGAPVERGATGQRGEGRGASDGDGPDTGRDLGPAQGADAEVDEELEEYNRYLSALNESRRRKRW